MNRYTQKKRGTPGKPNPALLMRRNAEIHAMIVYLILKKINRIIVVYMKTRAHTDTHTRSFSPNSHMRPQRGLPPLTSRNAANLSVSRSESATLSWTRTPSTTMAHSTPSISAYNTVKRPFSTGSQPSYSTNPDTDILPPTVTCPQHSVRYYNILAPIRARNDRYKNNAVPIVVRFISNAN